MNGLQENKQVRFTQHGQTHGNSVEAISLEFCYIGYSDAYSCQQVCSSYSSRCNIRGNTMGLNVVNVDNKVLHRLDMVWMISTGSYILVKLLARCFGGRHDGFCFWFEREKGEEERSTRRLREEKMQEGRRNKREAAQRPRLPSLQITWHMGIKQSIKTRQDFFLASQKTRPEHKRGYFHIIHTPSTKTPTSAVSSHKNSFPT